MSIKKLVFVKGVVPKVLSWVKDKVRDLGLDEDKNVRLDEKKGETVVSCNVDGNRIVSVVPEFVPQFIKFFVPCFKGSAVVRVAYKDRDGKDQVKFLKPEREGKNYVFFRNGEVAILWGRILEICYLGARSAMENGKKVWYAVYDDIFYLAIPDYIKSDEDARNFIKKNGLPERFHEALGNLSINIKMEYHEKQPKNNIDIGGKSKDGLPGVAVAHSEPGDENPDKAEDKANSQGAQNTTNRKADRTKTSGKGDKSSRKPKPEDKKESNQKLTADAKAGAAADVA